MKITLIILAYVASTSAAPKITSLDYGSLYKVSRNPVPSKAKARLIGGKEVTPHSLPYQAFLEIVFPSDDHAYFCGGSLISENFVLSSANCVYEARKISVVLGAHRIFQENYLTLDVRYVTIHENFEQGKFLNDISLLRLSASVRPTTTIRPVNLPSRADIENDFVGQTARASGWGKIDQHTVPYDLRYLDLKVISHRECELYIKNIGDSILCTSGEEDTGPCNGDTGGPLVLNNVLIGVITITFDQCPRGLPAGYSRITSFLDWISRHSDVEIH